MTSQKDQIQALIVEIDGVLQKTTPRLPWVMSGEVAQQRQVLERVRNYLIALQRRMMVQEGYGQPGNRPELLAHDIYHQSPQAGYQGEVPQASPSQEASAQQMLQMVIQEMGYLRANLMQPLQMDLETLRQQREALVQEIHQLEAQRQGYGLTGQANQQQLISEFLQALMGRLQETLPQQMAQMMGSPGSQSLPYASNPMLAGSNPEYLALQQLQAQSSPDRLIVNLDSTLKVIFESLERNVKAYQESLTQGLDRMHGLGQQGEVMFTALVNHLAQQLGREASTYLQSSGQFVEVDPAKVPGKTGEISPPAAAEDVGVRGDGRLHGIPQAPTPSTDDTLVPQGSSSFAEALENLRLPYAGAELPLAGTTDENLPLPELVAELPVSESSVDTAIDAWLRSAQTDVDTAVFGNLTVPGLDLENIDLSQVDAQNIDAILEMAGIDLSQPPIAPLTDASEPVASPGEEDTADIDAALKLLEQLSSELQDESALPSLEDTEAEIDRMLVGTDPAPGATVVPEVIAGDARNELDEFYESLFGGTTTASDGEASPIPADSPVRATTDTVASVALPDLPVMAEVSPDTPVKPDEASDPTLGWDVMEAGAVTAMAVPDGLDDALLDQLELLEPVDQPVVFDQPEFIDEDTTPFSLSTEEAEPLTDSLGDLFGDDQPSQTADAPAIANNEDATESAADFSAVDQISALTDLFDDSQPEGLAIAESTTLLPTIDAPSPSVLPPTLGESAIQPPFFSPDVIQSNESLSLTDDRYTPASPEEDLLAREEPISETDSELWLDEGTLFSLSEDLSSLEIQTGRQPAAIPEHDLFVEGELDASLDWEVDETQPEPASDRTPEAGASSGIPAASISTDQVESSATAFTLDGMDDLFADLPSSPSVSPIPPPGVSTGETTPFSLEGINDLFSEGTDLPPANPIAAPATPFPFQQEVDLPPADQFSAVEVPPSVISPPVEQSMPFTLEGMNDLFADIPLSVTPESLSEATQPDVPIDVVPLPDDSLSSFTLEGMGDLFGNTASADATMPLVSPVPPPESAFRLEGMDDLFSALSPTDAIAPSVSPEPPPASSPNELTPEQVGDLFGEDTPMPSTQASVEPSGFTLEQIGDLFVETPTDTAAAPVAATTEPSAFTLDPIGDLFVETPASPSSDLSEAGTEVPAFTLEQIDDLFVDPPANPPSDTTTAEAEANQTDAAQVQFDELTLEQAFESLMGSPTAPPTPVDSPDTEPPTSEKKKKAF